MKLNKISIILILLSNIKLFAITDDSWTGLLNDLITDKDLDGSVQVYRNLTKPGNVAKYKKALKAAFTSAADQAEIDGAILYKDITKPEEFAKELNKIPAKYGKLFKDAGVKQLNF